MSLDKSFVASDELSAARCILLAIAYASAADIESLHHFTTTRTDVFNQELVFRILLTYLPESLDPAQYIAYIQEIGTRIYFKQHSSSLDISSVENITQDEAVHRVRKLNLRPLADAAELENRIDDNLTLFLTSRARSIDRNTGLLPIVSQLVGPFFNRNSYLKEWFVANVLTLIRLDYEYHPSNGEPTPLAVFEELHGQAAVAYIMSKAAPAGKVPSALSLGRDLRGLVGPWTHGCNLRKRRRLGYKARRQPLEEALRKSLKSEGASAYRCEIQKCMRIFKSEKTWRQHVELSHGWYVESLDKDPTIPHASDPALHYTDKNVLEDTLDWVNAWRATFQWIVDGSVQNFEMVVNVLEGWDGPSDVDIGEYADQSHQMDEDLALDLLRQYCQAAFASIYAVEKDDAPTVDGAHAILVRLADLLGFEPPPELATSIELLPRIERHVEALEDYPRDLLQYQALLLPGQPLTNPALETFSLLQMFVYSAYQLLGVGQPMSVAKVAKLRFWSDATEQLQMITAILETYSHLKRDESQWSHLRDVLIWLWGWGLEVDPKNPKEGYGIFGRASRQDLEQEILKAFCRHSQFPLAISTYVIVSQDDLDRADVERIMIDAALDHFDKASNGNKTRGGVKRANDLLLSLKPHFSESSRLQRILALVEATHAMSFYSLTLTPGIPFNPSEIRSLQDPLTLVPKLLDQNTGSYTKLDDLIRIAEKLVVYCPTTPLPLSPALATSTSRKVTGMAIEAALRDDDFETAFSYVINRLTTSAISTDIPEDDVAWRAAYAAGKHRSSKPSSSTLHASPQARRLEQRMDLLSQALLLAPPSALSEVLAAWRRAEEELLTVLANDEADEDAFDDRADARATNVNIPGGFGAVGEPTFIAQPRRKEIGRGANEEAPMGLFDVARGAAAAFSRNTSSLSRTGTPASVASSSAKARNGSAVAAAAVQDEVEGRASGERVRKRDMVANAVTGGLASGIGWMIGAKPVSEAEREW